jgi:hypothetical protein
MNISPHFTLDEAIFSSTAVRAGIDNYPSPEIIANMTQAAAGMEKVRMVLGERPIHVDSWFRCLELNKLVGGSATSAHLDGWAIDHTCRLFGTPFQVAKAIESSEVEFDQLILEGTWVHISFKPGPRRMLLTAHFANGKATYTQGIS